jgi:hypothetical protein
MRPIYLGVALLTAALAGCKTCSHEEGCGQEVVVKAPPTKVILEQPPAPSSAPPAPSAAPPAPAAAPPAPVAAPPAPAMAFPAINPMTLAAAGAVTGHIRERTGLGIVFDSFEISIPYPRLIAVPKPAQMTVQVPAQTFAPQMAMPMMMAPPMMPQYYPQTFLPPAPTAAPPTPPAAPPTPPAAPPTPPAAPPAPPAAPPTEVDCKISDAQCDDIIKKCEALKRLRIIRQHVTDCCPK